MVIQHYCWVARGERARDSYSNRWRRHSHIFEWFIFVDYYFWEKTSKGLGALKQVPWFGQVYLQVTINNRDSEFQQLVSSTWYTYMIIAHKILNIFWLDCLYKGGNYCICYVELMCISKSITWNPYQLIQVLFYFDAVMQFNVCSILTKFVNMASSSLKQAARVTFHDERKGMTQIIRF